MSQGSGPAAAAAEWHPPGRHAGGETATEGLSVA